MFFCYILIGPSGSGKTTLASQLFRPEQKVISYTTRLPRPQEVQEKDYHFVSQEAFTTMILNNEFAEYDCYAGNYYGVRKAELDGLLEKNHCYDVLTATGFWHLRERYGQQIIPIYLEINQQTLLTRLKHRGDPPEVIDTRMELYQKEQAELKKLKTVPELICLDGNQPTATILKEAQNYLSS